MYIILVYDISVEDYGQRRWKKTFKTCKKYLTHIQKSVFEGEITASQLIKLEYELKSIIKEDLDSILVFKSRNERWLEKLMWGIKDDATSPFL